MNDRGTVRLVIGGLVILSLAMLALVGIIAVDDAPASVPEALWTLLGGALGALGAMLARTGTEPDPVTTTTTTSPATQTTTVTGEPTVTLEPEDHFH